MIYRKLRERIYQSSQAGFTLMESMVAMVLVSILAVSISPMLGFWVASRVQARRAELGAMAARTYIDGLRAGSIRHPTYFTNNPTSEEDVDVSDLTCPKGNDYCDQPSLDKKGEFFCINGDDTAGCQAESLTDLVLHVGSYNPLPEFSLDSDKNPLPPGEANYDLGYQLDVRVYRADAFSKGSKLLRSNSTESKTSRVSGFPNKKAPLIEISTDITTGETNYYELKNLLEKTKK